MTPTQFVRAATLLFGERWQTAMAAAVERDRSTVIRWAAGTVAVPDRCVETIRGLLAERRVDLRDLLDEVSGEAAE